MRQGLANAEHQGLQANRTQQGTPAHMEGTERLERLQRRENKSKAETGMLFISEAQTHAADSYLVAAVAQE